MVRISLVPTLVMMVFYVSTFRRIIIIIIIIIMFGKQSLNSSAVLWRSLFLVTNISKEFDFEVPVKGQTFG